MADAVTLKMVGDWRKEVGVPLRDALAVSMNICGRTGEEACKHAIILMAQSARAITKQSPKLRPIVKNPDPRYKTDARRAPFGVYAYKGRGNQSRKYFKPIYRTGEFGRVRFLDKNTLEIKYINTFSGKVHRADRYEQVPGLSIKTDKRRNIGRRGLAKQAWMYGLSQLGGPHESEKVKDASSVRAIRGDYLSGYIKSNLLDYITKILPAGWEKTVELRAGNKIMKQAQMKLERQFKSAMLRREKQTEKSLGQFFKAVSL